MSAVRTAASALEDRRSRVTMLYQPKNRVLVVDFPNQGTYLYHDVPARAYATLKRSTVVHARFVEDRRRHYSIVAAP
jgi:KTSC domain